MPEPPADLSHDVLRERVRVEYGLEVADLSFLPLGHDALAWVYRLRAADGLTYFLKARRGPVNEAGLLVPRELHDHGVAQVVAPLPAASGALWTEQGGYRLVLYPFIDGVAAMEGGMTPRQWIDYGRLLRQVHDTAVDPALSRVMRRESFVPDGADAVRRLDPQIGTRSFADPSEAQIARFWQARRPEILALLERAEELARRLARASPTLVLCHADIHTANVLIDSEGQVWFVDWDETTRAPRERDLMFVVGGISSRLVTPEQEKLFLQGYGATDIDPLALAYYRYNWAASDIGAFGEQVFLRPDLGPDSKREAADLFLSLFEPGEIVSLALAAPIPAG